MCVGEQTFGVVGTYKGVVVEVQPCDLTRSTLTRQDLIDLKLVSTFSINI